MGRNVSNQTGELELTSLPYSQKKINVLSSTGWTQGDYVYGGPGSTGYGFPLPATTDITVLNSVKQGVVTPVSTVTLNTRAALTSPMQ